MDRNARIQCPCCSRGRVVTERIAEETWRESFAAERVPEGTTLRDGALSDGANGLDAFGLDACETASGHGVLHTCAECEYEWSETTFYCAEGVRIVDLTFSPNETTRYTMRVRKEDVMGIGFEEDVGVLYLEGGEEVEYEVWHERLCDRREQRRNGVGNGVRSWSGPSERAMVKAKAG